MDTLGSLVDSSLVRPEPREDEPRFSLLETIRVYALERLRESGDWQEVHDRHAAYFLALAEPADDELHGPGQLAWLNRLEIRRGNLDAALSWLTGTDQLGAALHMIWTTWRFWWLHGHAGELARHVEEVLAKSASLPPRQRALALSAAGFVQFAGGDQARARRLLKQSLPLYRQAGDRLGMGLTAAALGHLLAAKDETVLAVDLLEQTLIQLHEMAGEELTGPERVQHQLDVALASTSSARSSSTRGTHQRAAELFTEGLAAAAPRPTGSPSWSRSTTWPSAARPAVTCPGPRTCSGRACGWQPRPETSQVLPTISRRWPPSSGGKATRSAPSACSPPRERCSRPTAAAGCTRTCRAPRTTTACWPGCAPARLTWPSSKPGRTAAPSTTRGPSSMRCRKPRTDQTKPWPPVEPPVPHATSK